MRPVDLLLPRLAMKEGELAVIGQERFVIGQTRQIVNVNDFCNECGDCTTFCVHHGRPWFDKPRLFLNEKDFLAEEHNAYRITGDIIRHHDMGRESQLTRMNGHLVYECPEARVTFTPTFEIKEMVAKGPFPGSLSLRDAAELAVLLKGVTETLPHLVVA